MEGAGGMSVKGIHWAQEMRGVCPYRKALLFALGERHHKDQNIVVADQVMLADDAGMTDRTVRKYLTLLESDGLISRRVVGIPGGGRRTHYILAFDRRKPQQNGPDRKDVPVSKPERNSAPVRKEIPLYEIDQTGTSLPDRSGTCVPFPKDTIEHAVSPSSEGDIRKPSKQKREASPEFDRLWAVWPAKGRKRSLAKAKVQAVFTRLIAECPADSIIAAAKAFVRETDHQFAPALDRWLKDGKFEHYLPSQAPVAVETDWPAVLADWLANKGWPEALGPKPHEPGYRGPLEPLRALIAGKNPEHPVIAALLAKLNGRQREAVS